MPVISAISGRKAIPGFFSARGVFIHASRKPVALPPAHAPLEAYRSVRPSILLQADAQVKKSYRFSPSGFHGWELPSTMPILISPVHRRATANGTALRVLWSESYISGKITGYPVYR